MEGITHEARHMPRKIDGLVVIPVFNEEEALPGVIQELTAYVSVENLLFVDDSSSDQTTAILNRSHVRYLRHPVNLGYKEALLTALHYGQPQGFRYFVFFDADGQHQTKDLLKIIQTFESGDYDFIIGSRFRETAERTWSLRHLVNAFFSVVVTRCSNADITDSTCGLKLISTAYLPHLLSLPSEDFHAELILALARSGARIREVQITVPRRQGGASMYHFCKALLYPTKTALCVLNSLLLRPA